MQMEMKPECNIPVFFYAYSCYTITVCVPDNLHLQGWQKAEDSADFGENADREIHDAGVKEDYV